MNNHNDILDNIISDLRSPKRRTNTKKGMSNQPSIEKIDVLILNF